MLLVDVSPSHGINVVRAMSEDLPVSLRPVSCTQPSAYQYSASSNSQRLTTPARRTCQRSLRVGMGRPPSMTASRQRVSSSFP